MDTSKHPGFSAASEVESADLGDARLNRRLVKIVDAMSAKPDGSIPQQAGSEAEREATYQFLNNSRVEFQRVLEPHALRTVDRIVHAGTSLVVHDTTEFHFRGDAHREGLGRLGRGSGEGFFCHLALGVGADGDREPLGVLGVETYVRGAARKPRNGQKKRIKEREALRWGRLIDEVESRIDSRARLIHLLDSEGDIYEVLLALQTKERGFVIRSGRDRALLPEEPGERPYLYSRVQMEVPVAQTWANLSARKTRQGKKDPKRAKHRNRDREARTALLDIRATRVRLRIPDQARGQGLATSVEVNVVSVLESNPPPGEEAVDWTLLTSEPIDSPEAIHRIVDWYRARWLIEEYFKAIKTGCAYEKAQLESYQALLIELAMTFPVAYDLLLARYLSRAVPDTPATAVFRETLLDAMRYELDGKLPAEPTMEEALLAVARLGGHVKSNGAPGWIVLGRGYQRALLLERGWRAARGLKRCDQS
jgi:hypothetical protein